MLPRHTRERVKGHSGLGIPAPFELPGVETSLWLNWLADRFPGCLLSPTQSSSAGKETDLGFPPDLKPLYPTPKISLEEKGVWAKLFRPPHTTSSCLEVVMGRGLKIIYQVRCNPRTQEAKSRKL